MQYYDPNLAEHLPSVHIPSSGYHPVENRQGIEHTTGKASTTPKRVRTGKSDSVVKIVCRGPDPAVAAVGLCLRCQP